MDTMISDMGEGVAVVQSDDRDPIEEVHDVSRSCNVINSEPNQQLNNCLAPVPEHDLLLHVDSLVHLGPDQLEEEHFTERMPGSGNHSGNNAGDNIICQCVLPLVSLYFVCYTLILS